MFNGIRATRFIHIAVVITMAAIVTILPASAQAQDQWPINFQGILLDVNGDPVTAPTSVLFTIWDDPVAGTSQWSETQVVTPDSDGRFNVLLGSVNPIPDAALAGGTAYIGTKVDTDPEMTPRAQLVSVGYSHRTKTVDGASGGTISSAVELQSDLTVSGNIIGSTPWTPFPFAAGYDNYADAHSPSFQRVEYRKIGDVVHIRGILHRANHAAIPNQALLGTLPPGFRPPATLGFLQDPVASLQVRASGDIVSNGSPLDFQYMDGIFFSTSP